MLQTLKMLVVNVFVVWNLNLLCRIHRHFWIKWISKLGFKTALGTNDSFNDFMRVNKSDVANSPKKIISYGKKCNIFSKFWMAPTAHNFDKFSSEKNMFFIWPGGGITLFVCGISQKKSVDIRFLGTSRLLYFLQSNKWTVSFFSVISYFTTADLVSLLMLIIRPRWIQCFPWFSTLTRSPTQTHIASQLVDSFFLLPKKKIWFEMMQYCTSNCLLPVAIPHLLLCH